MPLSLILLALVSASPNLSEVKPKADHKSIIYVHHAELNDVYEWNNDGTKLVYDRSVLVFWNASGGVDQMVYSPDDDGVLIEGHQITFRHKKCEMLEHIFIFESFENTTSLHTDTLVSNDSDQGRLI